MEFDGYAVAHGVPPLYKLPLPRLCSFVWFRLTENAKAEDVESLRAKLWMPPKGVEADERSPWSAANEAKAFAAVKAQLGV